MSEAVKVKDKRHLIIGAILCAIIVLLLLRRGQASATAAPFTVSVPNVTANFAPYTSPPLNFRWPQLNKYIDTALCACGCSGGRKAGQSTNNSADPLVLFANGGPRINPVFLNEYQPPVKPPASLPVAWNN